MPQILMVALTDYTQDGQLVAAIGEVFTCTPVQAAVAVFQQTARFAEPNEALPVKVEPPPTPEPAPEPPKRKRTYRRRDLRAER